MEQEFNKGIQDMVSDFNRSLWSGTATTSTNGLFTINLT